MFGEKLTELLKINNMYQSDLASEIGYTTQAVSRWCRGETEPDTDTLLKLSKFFGVSIDYLLGNEKKINEKEKELKEKEALKNALIKAGYMKDNEDLTNEELERLMKFVKNNKDFIKEVK